MDKLKPILVHKFWIMAGLALLVPFVGWWMDTGDLAAQITTRRDDVKKAFDGTQVGPDTPNDKWEAELVKINKIQDEQLRASAVALWNLQKVLMKWPEDLSDLLTKVEYLGEISNTARDLYRTRYTLEIAKMIGEVKPYDPGVGEGLVVVDPAAIKRIPQDRWLDLPPTSPEMWNAQEDIWLWGELLRAISRVNEGANTIQEASVREIKLIELLGGSLKNPGGSGSGGSTTTGDAALAGGAAAPLTTAPGFGGGGGGGGGAGSRQSATDYNPTEDFGAQSSGGGPAAPNSTDMTNLTSPTAGAGATTSSAGAAEVRYVDLDSNLPYKHRGFHIKVVMDHRKVPDLLVQLSNLPYPVTIIRVQQVAKFDDIEGGGGNRMAGPNMNPMAGGFGAPATSGFGATADGPVGIRPSGTTSPRLPMGGVPGGVGNDPNGKKLETARNVLDAAMSDPYLATVSVAGIMTLYQPPKTTGAPAEQTPPAVQTPPATPEATTPPAGSQPPAATDPAGNTPPSTTPPAEGDKPAESATEPAKPDPAGTDPVPDGNNPKPASTPEAGANESGAKSESPPKTEANPPAGKPAPN